MRTALLLMFATTALAGSGCKSLLGKADNPKPRGDIPKRSEKDLVDYLNRQAGYLNSVSYSDVAVYATENGKDMPRLGDSSLHAQKPRDFRLLCATGFTNGEVDLGSNDREFWMYVKRLDGPNFLYCSHEDFARGAGKKFPIPFDTDWIMQALGMASYPANGEYTATVNEAQRKYVLSQRTVTSAGIPVRRLIAFNVDHDSGNKPVVWKHLIADDRNQTLASAEIVSAKTVTVSGQYVQIPTEVILDWPVQKFRMRLVMDGAKVNEGFQERAALFAKPQIRGANPIDLATYQFDPMSRGEAPERRR